MHRHEHEAVTGCIIELCVLALQAGALSLALEVCLATMLQACHRGVSLAAAIIFKPDIFSNEARSSKTCPQSRQAKRKFSYKSTQRSLRTSILLNTHKRRWYRAQAVRGGVLREAR